MEYNSSGRQKKIRHWFRGFKKNNEKRWQAPICVTPSCRPEKSHLTGENEPYPQNERRKLLKMKAATRAQWNISMDAKDGIIEMEKPLRGKAPRESCHSVKPEGAGVYVKSIRRTQTSGTLANSGLRLTTRILSAAQKHSIHESSGFRPTTHMYACNKRSGIPRERGRDGWGVEMELLKCKQPQGGN